MIYQYSGLYTLYECTWFIACLPVHGDLVVGLRGQRDPTDAAGVVGGVNLSKYQLTTLLTTVEFK